MKVSHNWLKTYLDFDLSFDELSYWLTALGLEVEGQTRYESIKGGLRGIVTGQVKACAQHPNADRLKVTTVDVGGENLLSIVCGAPNVAAGQKVLVATIGTELYSPEGEAWTIKKSKIRGELSEGMICAEDELGLGNSHEGILVLDEATEIGQPATNLFPIEFDTIYEIGLTPNRSDGTSHLGVARDLAAGLGYHEGAKKEINYPTLSKELSDQSLDFTVRVENASACPRYTGLLLKGIVVGESPAWLINRLESIGVRPINNVVDITNFVLHEYGQPLHAFDLDKIKGQGIIVKNLAAGSKFTTLDEVERTLDAEDLMICDAEGNPMCIGGVFGGIGSGVTASTTSIFLESAHFDPESIRRTSMRHNLRTDAAKVFEKGSDPNIADEALWRAANLMQDLCGASICQPFFDLYPNPILKKSIHVNRHNVNTLIGVNLSKEELSQIFDYLNFIVEEEVDDTYQVLIPTDKADVLREADVIEEVLRIYGYDRVPVSSKLKTSIVHMNGGPRYVLRNRLISRLNARGFHQMMNLSLSRSAYYDDTSNLVGVLNTSNSHLDIMRPDLVHSALEAVAHNVKHQNKNVQLFELGSKYHRTSEDYRESEVVSIVVSGDRSESQWQQSAQPADFYWTKAVLEAILPKKAYDMLHLEEADIPYADFGQVIKANEREVGCLIKVDSALAAKFDIDQAVYYAEIDFDFIHSSWENSTVTYQNVSRFPGVQRDIALVVDDAILYEQISEVIRQAKIKKLVRHVLFDIYSSREHLGEGKKSMAIRMDFVDQEKTLSDKEVDKMIAKIVKNCARELGATLR